MINRKFLIFIMLFFSVNIFSENESIFDNVIESNIDELQEKFDVTIVALNKITAKSKKIVLKEGRSFLFDNLIIKVNKTFKNSTKKEIGALISVFEQNVDSDATFLFQGWIISPKKYVSTINHPIYEILLIDSKASID
jgi:hypothetical protein